MNCIEAKGTLKNVGYQNGYGMVELSRGKRVRAHRLVWEQCFGIIPDGMCVCHECDNPACVNPEHLFLGSHTENMRDMKDKGRVRRGSSHPRSKFTADDVFRIRGCGESVSDLARVYGVAEQSIRDVRARRTWAWLV